jgi:hypothetical protein
MASVTILECAIARGAKETPEGGMTLGAIEATGLPFMGGCQRCGACIAAYNACPSTTGYLMCAEGCIGDEGFPTAKAFDAWCAYQDALTEANGEEASDDE